MYNLFFDKISSFNQYNLSLEKNIFESILQIREKDTIFDKERFFLKYIPESILSKYDFNNKDDLKRFREICLTMNNPLMKMGGCNLRDEYLKKD